jgi:UDP-N-acetylglucosamine 2-epimerase (non-hydrolysing)
VTGNTVIDCLFEALKLQHTSLPLFVPVERLTGRRLILVTAHRRENWDHGLGELCLALREIVQVYPDVIVLFPVHLNPVVRRTVFPVLGSCERVLLVDPLPYWAFIEAMERAFLILTDSGGVQEEAPSLGKPVLVIRETTERPEALFAGSAHLVGSRRHPIMEGMRRLLDDPAEYERLAIPNNPFGDGQAAKRIVAAVLHYFGCGEPPQPFVPAQKERASHAKIPVASA